MRTLTPLPLAPEIFAPFGDVTDAPALGQRLWLDAHLVNQRPVAAKPSLSIARIDARLERPMPLTVIERHEFSSQSFIALDDGQYLVVVAPSDHHGGADLAKAQAFIANSHQAITYRANVWHGPMTPLNGPMRFAIAMFNDGISGDEEVIRLDQPFAMLTIA